MTARTADRPTSLVSWWENQTGRHPITEHLLPLPPPPPGTKPYTRLKPHLAQRIVDTYLRPGDRVLDSCAGWATFSSVARFNGYAVAAADVWPVSHDFITRQLAAIPSSAPLDPPRLADARQLPYADRIFQIYHSNLPIPAVSRYSGDPGEDMSRMSQEAWGNALVELMLEAKRVLVPGGLAIVTIHDRRDGGAVIPYHATTIASAARAELAFHDEVVYERRTISATYVQQHRDRRTVAKCHEYLLVFRRRA